MKINKSEQFTCMIALIFILAQMIYQLSKDFLRFISTPIMLYLSILGVIVTLVTLVLLNRRDKYIRQIWTVIIICSLLGIIVVIRALTMPDTSDTSIKLTNIIEVENGELVESTIENQTVLSTLIESKQYIKSEKESSSMEYELVKPKLAILHNVHYNKMTAHGTVIPIMEFDDGNFRVFDITDIDPSSNFYLKSYLLCSDTQLLTIRTNLKFQYNDFNLLYRMLLIKE